MNKKGKRILSLFVFLATIISFLPINLAINEEKANAAVENSQITVTGKNINNKLTPTADKVYTSQSVEDSFTITVPNKVVDSAEIKPGKTGIIKQEIIIVSIDGVNVEGKTLDQMNDILDEYLGSSIDNGSVFQNGIGVKIKALPLGVNKIEYRIKETTQARTEKVTDKDTGITTGGDLQTPKENYYPSQSEAEEITIQHAKTYVQSKVDSLYFDSYIGTKKAYDDEVGADETGNSENNAAPFKFTAKAESDTDIPLSYTFDVPDGTDTLNYRMKFNGVSITDPLVLRNGVKDENFTVDNNELVGSLSVLGQQDLITIKMNDSSAETISKAYAIEIKYNYLSSDNDYTLREAGITKYNYNDSEEVKAYIGKHFTRSTDTKDKEILTYKGKIYIDQAAGMIAMEPKLGRTDSKNAFKISNHYGNGNIENSKLINGKQYVDFNKGSENELWLDIYEGKDGSVVDSNNILARYKLEVIILDSGDGSSDIDLSFDDSTHNSYLTQPGRDVKIPFDADRRTYDLYSKDKVDITLKSPNTNKNEYIKVWFGNDINSDNVTEAAESIANIDKNNVLTVDVGNYKKMVVQAYYDKIEYQVGQDGNIETDSSGQKIIKSIKSSPIGYKYIFYIKKNISDDEDQNNPDSNNAALKNIKVEDGKLKDTDGNTGFSSDKYSYTVTIPKENKSAKITATSEEKVYEMTATIGESDDKYDMKSGEAIELPLNESGKTTVKISVTATDKTTKKTYTIIINNDTRSSEAELANVIVDPGTYDFAPDEDTTKVYVDLKTTKVSITPIPKNDNAKVYVDGDRYTNKAISVSLKGSQETEVDIEVVSEDGSDSNTYTLKIIRTDEDIEDEDDDDDDVSDIFYDEYNECWVDLSKYEEWGKIKGKDVYFDKNGRQVKDSWITVGKYGDYKYYYLDAKGYKQSGWVTDSTGKRYYLDPVTGERKSGYIFQDGKWYYLDESGTMHTGWLYDKKDNGWQYFLPSGQMVTNTSMSINGKVYNFGIDGKIF